MGFEFATATRILFGAGVLQQAGTAAKAFGSRALVVTGRDKGRADPLRDRLKKEGVGIVDFSVFCEPTVETVEQGVKLAKNHRCDFVISLGGGSALDTGKAIAAMLTNPGELLDFLEVIGKGKTLTEPSAPFIAIPTTAGTGSEVTRNAVLGSPEHHVKVSLRSPLMLPKLALVDPELTCDLPAPITASTGLDALTQVLEPYVSSRANHMTDALCAEGMQRAARSLRAAFENPKNASAREDMCVASLFGGLALANAGLGAVHGFAGPIGGMFLAPHGAVCAALLPHVMTINLRALRQRQPEGESLRRYDRVSGFLTGKLQAVAEDGVAWVLDLVRHLKIPGLSSYGITQSHCADLVDKAAQASSMKANPLPLTKEEMGEILMRAL